MPSRSALLTLAFLSSTGIALAQGGSTFFVKDGGWTIMGSTRGCDAVNRDVTEFNVAPYNALWLTRYAGMDPQTMIRVFYWPGALEPEQAVTLHFELSNGQTFEMTAMTTEDLIADTDYRLTDENIRALDTAGHVIIRMDGKPALAFRTRGILDASQYLERCTSSLPPQP
jgi:hypothetical protein